MNTTSKLGLNLPEGTDWADVAKLNENFEKLDAAVSAARSAGEYDADKSYTAGDYCLRDGTLYRCTTATEGEAWNEAHWAATTLAAELQTLYAALAGKAPLIHAAQHASDGADPITPTSIGAAAANHTHTPASIGAASEWTLIQEYRAAGAYTWTAPDLFGGADYKIGVYMVGGGGSGATNTEKMYMSCATGGASGYGKNVEMTVTPGQQIAAVVGTGGAGVTANTTIPSVDGNAGGTTSFSGITVFGGDGGKRNSTNGADAPSGGQGADCARKFRAATVPIYGSCSTLSFYNQGTGMGSGNFQGGTSQSPRESQNRFDPGMVTLCAGGASGQTILAMPDGTKGGNGTYASTGARGGAATGNGNGGGAAHATSETGTAISGAGSPGMLLIYAKAV